MTTDVRREHELALRHRFERLQRRDRVGQLRAAPRIDERIERAVVTLHLVMTDAADETHALVDAEIARSRAKLLLVRAAADEHGANVAAARGREADRLEQQVEPFVTVERADEADRERIAQPEIGSRARVDAVDPLEALDVDGVGDHGDRVLVDSAGADLAAQTVADRR